MNSIVDKLVVGCVLVVSAGYVITSLAPRGLKPHLLATLSRCLALAPAFFGLRILAQRVADASTAEMKGACGGCDSCGSETSSPQKSPTVEVSVPVTKIGRRKSNTSRRR